MQFAAVLLVCVALVSCARSESSKSSNGNAGSAQPNMEVPLQASASHHHKQLRSSSGGSNNYGSMQNYGGSDSYGGTGGYESSPQNYGFNCYGRPPALYGDGNYDCRIFHVCQADGRQDTLYCPKRTRFNNYLGVCDWEEKIDRTCMPLYKEEYTSNGNNYGSQNYEQGLQGSSYTGSQQGYSGRRSDYSSQHGPYQRRR